MRFLVFTTDLIPLPGVPTSGTALRTFGIISGLRSHGHEVVVSVPRSAVHGFRKRQTLDALTPDARILFLQLEQLAFDSFNQSRIIEQTSPDVIICGHWPAMILETKPIQPLIVDLAGPHLLERHYQGSPHQDAAVLAKLAILATADFFIVSGPTQGAYFHSFMDRVGVENPLARMIRITMPLSPEVPAPRTTVSPEFPRFIFGGVFLPWQDPSKGLRQLAQTLERERHGQLLLIGGKHPNYAVKSGLYDQLFSELEHSERVTLKPLAPFDKFLAELGQADIALDLMSWNLERELAVTIRSTTYLWSGLPVIYNDFADLSELIKKYNAGWCINPDNTDELVPVLEDIWRHPEIVLEKAQGAHQLAVEEFSWDKAVLPLLQMLDERHHFPRTLGDIIIDAPDIADFPVTSKTSVSQRFISRLDGLNEVSVRLATHGRKPIAPITLTLERLDETSRQVATHQWSDAADRNNDWLTLKFPPESGSAGVPFALTISSAAQSETESASPWVVKWSPYPMREFTYSGDRIAEHCLCLRTRCVGQF